MSLIEGRRGLRRRPLWEFEIDTARQQLNLQFGTRDLVGFQRRERAARTLCCRLSVAVCERYPTHDPAAYSFYHHGT